MWSTLIQTKHKQLPVHVCTQTYTRLNPAVHVNQRFNKYHVYVYCSYYHKSCRQILCVLMLNWRRSYSESTVAHKYMVHVLPIRWTRSMTRYVTTTERAACPDLTPCGWSVFSRHYHTRSSRWRYRLIRRRQSCSIHYRLTKYLRQVLARTGFWRVLPGSRRWAETGGTAGFRILRRSPATRAQSDDAWLGLCKRLKRWRHFDTAKQMHNYHQFH